MAELKPCPFCGKQPSSDKITIISTHGRKKEIEVVMCQCGGIMLGLSKEEAIEAWNRRVEDASD